MHGCKLIALAALACLVVSTGPAKAQSLDGATLLNDMSALPQARDGVLSAPVRVGQALFFVANTLGAGAELHVSDLDFGNLRLVADLFPGTQDSAIDSLRALGNGVVFSATDGRGSALWVSDGTAAGTRRIAPEPDINNPDTVDFLPRGLTVAGQCVWFSAETGNTGREPWRYCALDNQLTFLGDLVPGPGSLSPTPFQVLRGQVFIPAFQRLFVSDASSAQARPFVVPGAPDLSMPSGFSTVFRDRLYFAGVTAEHGRELWVTDGTEAGTRLVRDLVPGPDSSNPTKSVVFNSALYFAATTPQGGDALRRYSDRDGTITRIADADGGDIFTVQTDAQRLLMTVLDADGGRHLWQSDGTPEGTVELPFPDGVAFSKVVSEPTRISGRSVVTIITLQHGFELWALPQSAEEPVTLIKDIFPGRQWGVLGGLMPMGNALLFIGHAPETGTELWRTQGTEQTTTLALNLGQDSNADSSFFFGPNADGDTTLFGPGVSEGDRALWLTDTTPEGTRRVQNFAAGIDDAGEVARSPFVDWAAQSDVGPVFSDYNFAMTSSGHWAVRNGRAQRIGDAGLQTPKRLGSALVAVGLFDGVYRTDGTADSFEKIFDPSIGVAGRIYPFMEIADDRAWFFADTPDNRVALWHSDGTPGGAARLAGVELGQTPFWHRFVGVLNEAAYFIAQGPGVALWQADRSGAKPVKIIRSWWGADGAFAASAEPLGQQLIFSLYTGSLPELWATDGSDSGTVRLLAGDPKQPRLAGSRLRRFGDHVYFVGQDSEHGAALWRTDGTPEGTLLFADVAPGLEDYPLGDMTVHDGALYFVATTGQSGAEIWRTDGNVVEQVTELLPGSLSAGPANLHSVQGKLIFSADDGVHGKEPWVLTPF